MKRFISLAICFLMIINIFPVTAFAEEEQSLEEIIRPQVEAFAKSIDQKNADGAAQDLLIGHGIGGNGKKLSVGKNSALTAVLMNSELMKAYFTDALAEMIRVSEEFELDETYDLSLVIWPVNRNYDYRFYIYDFDYDPGTGHGDNYTKFLDTTNYIRKFHSKNNPLFPTKFNSYDESLRMMAGGMHADLHIVPSGKYEDKITYEVNVRFDDTFDFDTDNSSALENLLGFIGMLLFEPFFWESKFDFEIEIPIEKPEENEIFGDFDGSGKVDVSDAYFARLVAAKLVEPTPEQLALCDVDRDGKITAIDANLIRKFAAGIIESLPIR